MTEIVSVQNRYNPLDRRSDDVLDVCARDGLAFLPWAPSGRATSTTTWSPTSPGGTGHALSDRHRLAAGPSPAMLPIPGTGSTSHLEKNVAAAQIKLTAPRSSRSAPCG